MTHPASVVISVDFERRWGLHYLLGTNQDAGVWGGLSEDERRAVRRARRRGEISRFALTG